jgi:hypothetical protein
MPRKESLDTDPVYHIFKRSIAGYVIFDNPAGYARMASTLDPCRKSFAPGRRSLLTKENRLLGILNGQ